MPDSFLVVDDARMWTYSLLPVNRRIPSSTWSNDLRLYFSLQTQGRAGKRKAASTTQWCLESKHWPLVRSFSSSARIPAIQTCPPNFPTADPLSEVSDSCGGLLGRVQLDSSEKTNEFNLDPDRLAVGGASAGAHLAAVLISVAMQASCDDFKWLTVPVCDLHSTFIPEGLFDRENCPYNSYREMEFTAILPRARMAFFHRHFLGGPRPAPAEDISPMFAPNFSNLAPALVSVAELDPLRDEGECYAMKLKAAGNRVEQSRFLSVPHTFAGLDGILESGRDYNDTVVVAMKRELRG